jgi:hypothetical protein
VSCTLMTSSIKTFVAWCLATVALAKARFSSGVRDLLGLGIGERVCVDDAVGAGVVALEAAAPPGDGPAVGVIGTGGAAPEAVPLLAVAPPLGPALSSEVLVLRGCFLFHSLASSRLDVFPNCE